MPSLFCVFGLRGQGGGHPSRELSQCVHDGMIRFSEKPTIAPHNDDGFGDIMINSSWQSVKAARKPKHTG